VFVAQGMVVLCLLLMLWQQQHTSRELIKLLSKQ
jgi:hypothetical protein